MCASAGLSCQVVVSEAKEKISKWMQQIQCLTNIPADDPVMQETVEVLESLTLQVGVIMKLHSTSLREKHWKAILQGQSIFHLVSHEYFIE